MPLCTTCGHFRDSKLFFNETAGVFVAACLICRASKDAVDAIAAAPKDALAAIRAQRATKRLARRNLSARRDPAPELSRPASNIRLVDAKVARDLAWFFENNYP